MRHITGTYIRNGKEVAFDCKVPSTWDELTKKQFATIIQVLHFRKADPFVISTSLLAALFDAKNFHILRYIPDKELHALVPLTNFLLEERPPLKNVFPSIKTGKNTHIAPADDLSNIGFGEWCFVYEFYRYYRITEDPKLLDKLIATLYRQRDQSKDPQSPDFDGDLRLRFNENLIDARAKHFAPVRDDIKNSILAWFTVALQHVAELRPHVFPKPDESEFEPDAPSAPDPDGRTWLTVFRELLGPKWGTTEQLKYTNAMFVLDELEDLNIAYEKSKRKT